MKVAWKQWEQTILFPFGKLFLCTVYVMYIPVYCVGEEPTAGVVVPGLEEDWVEPVTVAHTAQGLSHFKPKEAAKR